MNISDSITKKIQAEEISPIPAWRFHVKYSLFWTLFLFSLFIGYLAVSLVLFHVLEADFQAGFSPLSILAKMIPLLWIISFALCFLLGYFGIKNTPKGYKIPLSIFLGINVFLSIGIGFGLYSFGIVEKIDRAATIIPFHHPLDERQIEIWNNPKEGRLAGKVESIGKGFLMISDHEKKIWKIKFSQPLYPMIEKPPQKNKEHQRPIKARLEGKMVKIEGKIIRAEDNIFEAKIIHPWRNSRLKVCMGPECEKFFDSTQ